VRMDSANGQSDAYLLDINRFLEVKMMKRVVILGLIVLAVAGLAAQQGKYERKSVSSVESVWLSGVARQTGDFDYGFFEKMIDLYIKVPRFDYNHLPEEQIRLFRIEANKLSVINANTIAEVLERTVAVEVKRILSDPQIQQARRADLEDESARIQVARLKGREFGLTEDQLLKLMSSAYIYLPYITTITKSYNNTEFTYSLEGGILWYRVYIAPDGTVSLIQKQSATASGIGTADAAKAKDYSMFLLGHAEIPTTVEQNAQYNAVQAWIKNLGVRMKEMPEFALSAQIMERLPGRKFSAELGFREGVHLDDGFFIAELYEDSTGDLQKRIVGYSRIIQTGDNRDESNRNVRSQVQAFYGIPVEGAVIMENPRLGIDLSVAMGYRFGMNIPQEASWTPFVGEVFNGDATSQLEFNFIFAYNLAPIVGIRQLFYDLEVDFGIPVVEYNPGVENGSALTVAAYTGLNKKLWSGRNALSFGAKVGYDRFVTTSTWGGYNISLAANILGFRGNVDYHYMLSPNWQFNIGLDLKACTPPFSSSLIIDEEEWDLGGSSVHEDISLGGVMLRVGLMHSLGQLPVNLFGWLDPLKRF